MPVERRRSRVRGEPRPDPHLPHLMEQNSLPATELPRVQSAFAKANREKAPAGTWVQNPDGQWVQT